MQKRGSRKELFLNGCPNLLVAESEKGIPFKLFLLVIVLYVKERMREEIVSLLSPPFLFALVQILESKICCHSLLTS